MNVLSGTLKEFNRLPFKGCTRVAFSNGGQYFACSVEKKNINVVNFYTSECPSYLQIKGHGQINQFAWFDDDSGFSTCDGIGNCYFYELSVLKETGQRT